MCIGTQSPTRRRARRPGGARRRTPRLHLQKPDGTIPTEPDRVLDLSIFRDTTPEGGLRPGKTLAGGGDAALYTGDLSGDGIPDYVISHRRKLWIFHGSKDGPRFTEPTSILKVAEDVTALLVTHLDDDERPDLLLLRVQIPSIAGLLTGLYQEIDLDISASGYANADGRTFSKTPKWRGKVQVRLPKIMGILRNPDALIRRFGEMVTHFRASAQGDFDGDGRRDVAMIGESGRRLGIWKGAGEADLGIGALFFSAREKVWTTERVLSWLRGVAASRIARATEGRDPDARAGVPHGDAIELVSLAAADLNGDKRDEAALVHTDNGDDGKAVVTAV